MTLSNSIPTPAKLIVEAVVDAHELRKVFFESYGYRRGISELRSEMSYNARADTRKAIARAKKMRESLPADKWALCAAYLSKLLAAGRVNVGSTSVTA